MINNLHLIFLAVLTVILAGLFAGAETGIYRLSRLRLRLAVEKRLWLFVLLGGLMHDSAGLLLSLLLGTNLAHYVATAAITQMFLAVVASERTAELLTTLLTAPLLFVFSELIPKNVFLYRAERLTSLCAPLLFVVHKVFTWCGVVPLLKWVSQAFGRLTGSPVSSQAVITSAQSQQVRAILRDTQEEGVVSSVQGEIIDRIISIPNLRLDAVMIPLADVQSIDVRSDREALLNKLKRHALTRLLVWRDDPGNIVGYVNIYDVLGSDEAFETLEACAKPIRQLAANTPVIDAIDIVRREGLKIVLVTRSRRSGRVVPLGIVTMKDLVEELLGELAEW